MSCQELYSKYPPPTSSKFLSAPLWAPEIYYTRIYVHAPTDPSHNYTGKLRLYRYFNSEKVFNLIWNAENVIQKTQMMIWYVVDVTPRFTVWMNGLSGLYGQCWLSRPWVYSYLPATDYSKHHIVPSPTFSQIKIMSRPWTKTNL